MQVMRSYVVRIYRQDARELTGLLESVETGDIYPFHSAAELCQRLSRDPALRRSTQSNSDDKESGS